MLDERGNLNFGEEKSETWRIDKRNRKRGNIVQDRIGSHEGDFVARYGEQERDRERENEIEKKKRKRENLRGNQAKGNLPHIWSLNAIGF